MDHILVEVVGAVHRVQVIAQGSLILHDSERQPVLVVGPAVVGLQKGLLVRRFHFFDPARGTLDQAAPPRLGIVHAHAGFADVGLVGSLQILVKGLEHGFIRFADLVPGLECLEGIR